MSSLAISVGNCSPTSNTGLLIRNLNKSEVSTFKLCSQQQKSYSPQKLLIENPTSFTRREAVGFGLCSGLLDVLLQTKPSAAAEEALCQLTLAPSGLAFCDKVVGVGPEAVKGQLIKVININHFSLRGYYCCKDYADYISNAKVL